MALRDLMSYDLGFLYNPLEMAVEVQWFPNGNAEKVETWTVTLHDDGLEGSREVDGDGRVMNMEHGVRHRESMLMEVPRENVSRITYDEGIQGNTTADAFVYEGLRWIPKRMIAGGREDGDGTVLLNRVDVKGNRRQRRRG